MDSQVPRNTAQHVCFFSGEAEISDQIPYHISHRILCGPEKIRRLPRRPDVRLFHFAFVGGDEPWRWDFLPLFQPYREGDFSGTLDCCTYLAISLRCV